MRSATGSRVVMREGLVAKRTLAATRFDGGPRAARGQAEGSAYGFRSDRGSRRGTLGEMRPAGLKAQEKGMKSSQWQPPISSGPSTGENTRGRGTGQAQNGAAWNGRRNSDGEQKIPISTRPRKSTSRECGQPKSCEHGDRSRSRPEQEGMGRRPGTAVRERSHTGREDE